MRCVACLFVPRRGGNYNNTSNTGLGYENVNNTRGNSNINFGARPALPPARSYAVKAAFPVRVEVKGFVSFDGAKCAVKNMKCRENARWMRRRNATRGEVVKCEKKHM